MLQICVGVVGCAATVKEYAEPLGTVANTTAAPFAVTGMGLPRLLVSTRPVPTRPLTAPPSEYVTVPPEELPLLELLPLELELLLLELELLLELLELELPLPLVESLPPPQAATSALTSSESEMMRAVLSAVRHVPLIDMIG
jgi:hypothetical protein